MTNNKKKPYLDFVAENFVVQNPLNDYFRVTYEFGKLYKWGRHKGVDLGTIDESFPSGKRFVFACADGVYLRVGFDPKGGNYVVIDHQNGFISKYFHLDKYFFVDGWTKVFRGHRIGVAGNTGSQTTAAHLHWELWLNGKAVDPLKYLYNTKKKSEIIFLKNLLSKKIDEYFI